MGAIVRGKRLVRLGVSLSLLLGLVWLLDPRELFFRFGAMQLGWVVAGVAVSVLQVVASAWRWRFTATRLGVDLRLSAACREYYRATFLNQVLPGGVMGDVSRAWRHGRSQAEAGSMGVAIRAVILERVSGQVVMMIVAVVSVASLSTRLEVNPWLRLLVSVVVVGVAVAGIMVWSWRRRFRADSLSRRFWRDARVALLSDRALFIQLASSVLIVASYLVTYLFAARAVGVDTPLLTLLPLIAPVLVTMLFPATIAGWGIREGTAAVLWSAVGLTAVDGVVVSVGYGLLVLLSSFPGSVILAMQMVRTTPTVA